MSLKSIEQLIFQEQHRMKHSESLWIEIWVVWEMVSLFAKYVEVVDKLIIFVFSEDFETSNESEIMFVFSKVVEVTVDSEIICLFFKVVELIPDSDSWIVVE